MGNTPPTIDPGKAEPEPGTPVEAERADDERRSQAARISAWVEAYRKPDGGREIAFHRATPTRKPSARSNAAAPESPANCSNNQP